MNNNLPEKHSILVEAFPALLAIQGSKVGGPIEEDSTRNSVQAHFVHPVIKRRGSGRGSAGY